MYLLRLMCPPLGYLTFVCVVRTVCGLPPIGVSSATSAAGSLEQCGGIRDHTAWRTDGVGAMGRSVRRCRQSAGHMDAVALAALAAAVLWRRLFDGPPSRR